MTVHSLPLGDRRVWPPVVLAPMAGITNLAFRRLCRQMGQAVGGANPTAGGANPTAGGAQQRGAGLYMCEMVTTRALVERNPKTLRMVTFGADESPRSMQLYGVDPRVTASAVHLVVEDGLADHVDLNFGCPVPKVTRKGGGAALPWRRRLFARLVRAAVDAAQGLPVTVKMRKGIDDDHLTYLEAGLAAQDAGVAWVALHGRTAAQRYAGAADWDAIAELKAALDIPVLGNGDIWEASDALRMLDHTGADGVVVGRGCLGRPWLFADLAAAFAGHPSATPRLPDLGEVAVTMRRHAELLCDWLGSEREGCTDFRKHVAWYLKGFPVGAGHRRALAMVSSLGELDDLLDGLDRRASFPAGILGQPRGRTGSPGTVALPADWLADRDDDTVPVGAELPESGG